MYGVLTIIPVAAGAYVATNLDNFALLVTLLARYNDRTSTVSAGYLAGMFILALAGYWIGAAAGAVPIEYLGFLGLVPMSIGAIGVFRLFRKVPEHLLDENRLRSTENTAFAATVVSQLGNGADTIVTFGALFADSAPASDIWIIVTLAVMAVVFVVVANSSLRHPGIKTWIERYAHLVTPFILIAVGAYIFANTATDMLPD